MIYQTIENYTFIGKVYVETDEFLVAYFIRSLLIFRFSNFFQNRAIWTVWTQRCCHQFRQIRRHSNSSWYWAVLFNTNWRNANECGRFDLSFDLVLAKHEPASNYGRISKFFITFLLFSNQSAQLTQQWAINKSHYLFNLQ